MERGTAYWTYDDEAGAWYLGLDERTPPPYTNQRRVEAILDLDESGRLAGVELLEQIIRLGGWWRPKYSSEEAHFWGWRHCLTIGPVVIFWGTMTEAELVADAGRLLDGREHNGMPEARR